MWFKFPEGATSISVEQQSFSTEATGPNGEAYFRAPDHFATRILAIPGFAKAAQPEGAPEDLPQADPLRDGAIAELTDTVEAQKHEIQDLRSDLNAATGKLVALNNDKVELQRKLDEALGKIEDLQEQLEDGLPQAPVVPIGKAKSA